MSAPRLAIDLDKIQHNARTLVDRLGPRGIAVTGVTKATLGSPAVARAMLRGGVKQLGDSRIENIETLRRAGVSAPMVLVRSPILSEVGRVVEHADASLNTELDVILGLSRAAAELGKTHGVVLMVELGDLREGILPIDLEDTVRAALRLPNISLSGVGTNLACRSGVAPGAESMAELSALAESVEGTFGLRLAVVSGGNSANLAWALGPDPVGRIDDLRLGEALLLGCDPLTRQPIEGLYTDAFTLTAEVIEAKSKPSVPWGTIGQSAFGAVEPAADRGRVWQTILALGRQDVDPEGVRAPAGVEVLAASSDHTIVDLGAGRLPVGGEVAFQLNYSALVRAMTSPFVTKVARAPSGADSDGSEAASPSGGWPGFGRSHRTGRGASAADSSG